MLTCFKIKPNLNLIPLPFSGSPVSEEKEWRIDILKINTIAAVALPLVYSRFLDIKQLMRLSLANKKLYKTYFNKRLLKNLYIDYYLLKNKKFKKYLKILHFKQTHHTMYNLINSLDIYLNDKTPANYARSCEAIKEIKSGHSNQIAELTLSTRRLREAANALAVISVINFLILALAVCLFLGRKNNNDSLLIFSILFISLLSSREILKKIILYKHNKQMKSDLLNQSLINIKKDLKKVNKITEEMNLKSYQINNIKLLTHAHPVASKIKYFEINDSEKDSDFRKEHTDFFKKSNEKVKQLMEKKVNAIINTKKQLIKLNLLNSHICIVNNIHRLFKNSALNTKNDHQGQLSVKRKMKAEFYSKRI